MTKFLQDVSIEKKQKDSDRPYLSFFTFLKLNPQVVSLLTVSRHPPWNGQSLNFLDYGFSFFDCDCNISRVIFINNFTNVIFTFSMPLLV